MSLSNLLSECRIKLLDTLHLTFSNSTKNKIYQNILLSLQGLLENCTLWQRNLFYSDCHFVIFFFSDNTRPRIIQFKSHTDFICVSNRSNTPQVLWQWKFLRVSKKHFLKFWLSRFVRVHISSTKGTRVRGNIIKILT